MKSSNNFSLINKLGNQSEFGKSDRHDVWWVGPGLTAFGLGSFIIYATWAAFQGEHYQFGSYLSPFYSPLFLFDWWHFSPALLILWAPAGFRMTCYYYRKAYYRAFFWDPPACAVGEGRKCYKGETRLFIIQNIHRYFLYLALAFIVILWIDAFRALNFEGHIGAGVGTIVLFANAGLLGLYTISCHCLRHLVGGRIDCFSTAPLGKTQYKLWTYISRLNQHHMLWAWLSLFMVGFADFYIRLCSMGVINDFRFL